MHVIELYRLTKWVHEEIVQKNLPQKYSQLHTILQQNSQPNQPKTAFETQKDILIKAINEVELMKLTNDQTSFLDGLEILPALGRHGSEQIENILFRNALDITTAAQKIKDILNKLNEGLRKIKLITEGLEGCVRDDSEEDLDQVLIRVSFLGDASISNVKDFKDWGAKWHDIGRGIAMAHGAAPEDVKIIGAAKGSVILELMACAAISGCISKIILDTLKVVEKVYDIRKTAEEVRSLKLNNKKIAEELIQSAEDEKKSGVTKIIEEQVVCLNLAKNGDGDKITALEKAIKALVDFIDRGGEVDFVVPEEDDVESSDEENPAESSYVKIREQAQEIRALEDKLKLLEHKNTEDK